ncbi:hypothetical protein CBM2634_A80263 [Cupriavidus taiwanensis]|uniref:Uncharacterized protein n=1 Tax=Cupriavidus taiwanensis TaxID=164546 RepID=A0A375J422_9BURK|nr:hypothetical protein CBM2634_A80263 [Cupriavidus taiwanensis]
MMPAAAECSGAGVIGTIGTARRPGGGDGFHLARLELTR